MLRTTYLGSLCLLVACTTTPVSSVHTYQAKLSAIQADIFLPSCANSYCHGGPSPAAGLALDGTHVYDVLVHVPATDPSSPKWARVIPGALDKSMIYQVLSHGVGQTQRMPAASGALEQDKIDAIGQWISAGALDN